MPFDHIAKTATSAICCQLLEGAPTGSTNCAKGCLSCLTGIKTAVFSGRHANRGQIGDDHVLTALREFMDSSWSSLTSQWRRFDRYQSLCAHCPSVGFFLRRLRQPRRQTHSFFVLSDAYETLCDTGTFLAQLYKHGSAGGSSPNCDSYPQANRGQPDRGFSLLPNRKSETGREKSEGAGW